MSEDKCRSNRAGAAQVIDVPVNLLGRTKMADNACPDATRAMGIASIEMPAGLDLKGDPASRNRDGLLQIDD